MIRRSLGLSILGVGLVVVAACGDDEAPAAKYPSADSFCTAKAAEECKAVAAACTVSEDVCKSARKSACLTTASGATGQGRTYNSGNAESCIAKTTAVYADRVIDPAKEDAFEEACGRVFAGAKKKNEACAGEFDCEGTLACDLDKKLCAVKVERKLDEGCANPGEICAKDLYCALAGAAKFCKPKNKVSESCSAEAPCADDLRCTGTQCIAKFDAGQPCDSADDCKSGFCNSDKKCQARQYASETGSCKDFGGS